ncbi:hypothetical protein [Candidatus Thiosymbion oneisti]|uniref:hypothetical protein n=1 Tax=Candidatus Thiosymbion oneisti TaxID=589554 RepID=UPI00105C179D|nr:hypothetical protein [Candidatus Thiosymbion oneisti]
MRDKVRALGYGDCLEARSLAELLFDPDIELHASLLLRSVVEVHGAQAGNFLEELLMGDFGLDESQRHELAFWMPAITRHNESMRLFAWLEEGWLEEDMFLQTDNLSALETKIAVARSYVCSRRAELEGLVSDWHDRFEGTAVAAGPFEWQRALSTRAELNTLLYETGSARTLSLLLETVRAYIRWVPSWFSIEGLSHLGAAAFTPSLPFLEDVSGNDDYEMALRIAAVRAMIRVDPKSARDAVETLLEIAIQEDTLVDEVKSLITEFDKVPATRFDTGLCTLQYVK